MQRINLHIETKQWFSLPVCDYTICEAFYADL